MVKSSGRLNLTAQRSSKRQQKVQMFSLERGSPSPSFDY